MAMPGRYDGETDSAAAEGSWHIKAYIFSDHGYSSEKKPGEISMIGEETRRDYGSGIQLHLVIPEALRICPRRILSASAYTETTDDSWQVSIREYSIRFQIEYGQNRMRHRRNVICMPICY
jgi:hypothetical protein